MRLTFKQAVSIDGRKFGLGAHEVPEELLTHPYMEKLVKCGFVLHDGKNIDKTPQQLQDEELKNKKTLEDRISLLKKKKEAMAVKEADAKENKEQSESKDDAEAIKEKRKNKNKG